MSLYLAFDVYSSECCLAKAFEVGAGLLHFDTILHSTMLVEFSFDGVGGAVGFEEFTTLIIVSELEFVTQVTE